MFIDSLVDDLVILVGWVILVLIVVALLRSNLLVKLELLVSFPLVNHLVFTIVLTNYSFSLTLVMYPIIYLVIVNASVAIVM